MGHGPSVTSDTGATIVSRPSARLMTSPVVPRSVSAADATCGPSGGGTGRGPLSSPLSLSGLSSPEGFDSSIRRPVWRRTDRHRGPPSDLTYQVRRVRPSYRNK